VSFAYLPPMVSFPMAMMAAINEKINKKKLTESEAEGAWNGIATWLAFAGDQSYNKQIGDFSRAASGDPQALSSFLMSPMRQFVPMASLQGWAAKAVDVYERDVKSRNPDKAAKTLETAMNQMKSGIPGLRQTLPEMQNPYTGELIERSGIDRALSAAGLTATTADYETENMGEVEDRVKKIRDTKRQVMELADYAILNGNLDPKTEDYMRAVFDRAGESLEKSGIRMGGAAGTRLESSIPDLMAIINDIHTPPEKKKERVAKRINAALRQFDDEAKSELEAQTRRMEALKSMRGGM